MIHDRTHAGFDATPWTLLDALGAEPADVRRDAMDELVSRYWPAVYAYLRRSGLDREKAAETTQAFFCDAVLPRELFQKADRARGKLRTLLLTALRNFRIDAHRRTDSHRAARIGEGSLAAEEQAGLDGTADPESIFERRWALAAVQDAVERCREHFRRTGKVDHWSLFEQRVLLPCTGQTTAQSLDQSARNAGFRCAADGAAAVQVVKKRLEAILKQVVAETVSGGTEAEEEYRRLRAALGGD